jgi:hypothetical protein
VSTTDPDWSMRSTEPGAPRPNSRSALIEAAGQLWPDAQRVTVERVGFRRPPGTRDLLALPSGDWPRVLAPVRPRRAAAAAFRRNDSRQSLRERVRRGAAVAALSTGALQLVSRVRLRMVLPVEASSEPDRDIESYLSALLGQEALVCVGVGSLRPNRKPVLQVVAPNGHCLGFAKLSRNELTAALVRRETGALRLLAELGLTRMEVPRILDAREWNGAPLLVMSPLSARPGRAGPPLAAMEEFARLTRTGPPGPLSATTWWQRQVREASPELAPLLVELERRHGSTTIAQAASHGDWTEWNTSRLPDGQAGVWDWERFTSDVPVGLDLVHWLVQGSLPHRLTGWGTAIDASLPQLRRGLPELGIDSDQAELILWLYLINLHVRYAAEAEGSDGRRVRLVAKAVLDELLKGMGA